MTNGHEPVGTDMSRLAAENSAYAEQMGGDGYAFSGAEIRQTFLSDGKSIGDTILRSHFPKDIAHLRAMQLEQGMRVLRQQAKAKPQDVPDRVKEYSNLPASMISAVVNGMVAAATDGGARSEALVAWGGGAMMMGKRRNIGSRALMPRNQDGLR